MPVEDAHRDACWVLTVVGGLALTKALEQALPAINFAHWSDTNLFIFLRLFIFCSISIRFFIGASVYFQKVHIEPGHDKAPGGFPESNFVVDFASCIVHFSLLYFMAVNILDFPTEANLPLQRFFLALCAVLLYDWVWFLVSAAYSTAPRIKKWAITNTIAAAACVVDFLMFRYGPLDRTWFEIILMALILLSGIPDAVQMAKGVLPD